MRLASSRTRAYWASGGAILGRRGPLPQAQAAGRFLFYARLALGCRRLGDRAGAVYCARRAHDLARALIAADDWRRAATGGRRRDFA